MVSRKISTVIFDWSGTISFDIEPVWVANMAILANHGKPTMDLEVFRSRIMMTAPQGLRFHGVLGTDEELQALYEQEFKKALDLGHIPTLYPDAVETLQVIHSLGVKLAVLSAHPTANLKQEVGRYGIGHLMSSIIGDSHDKTVGLNFLMGLFGIRDPRNVIYIGDTVHDVEAAQKAGTVSAAVCNGYHVRERLETSRPDHIFDDLTALRTAFENGAL